ncbi:MAG: carboxypeptidase-like regulatory domain-containing protein, partial [Bryobacteraceae bacterium]
MNLKRLVPAAVVILISQTIQAQQTSLSGTISDSSGAVIAEAIVRATPAGGGAGLTVITSRTGAYQFPSLVAADYLIRIETPGFTPAERTVTLLVGQSLTMDVQLRPAQSASTIEVSAAGAEVSVTTSQVGGTVDPNRMKDVPLNGRNWLELSLLVPGITQNSVNSVPLGNSGGRFQLNLDGQQVSQNSAGATFGQPQYSRDAISQFQIITNRFDATLGRSSQIQVNAETKSGSNEFHGSAYGYFRHDSMNAADPISHTVLPFSDQQYGGTFGGTLIRDKLFFFAGYERERKPSTVYTIPLGFEPQSFTFATSYNSQSLLTRFDYQLSGGSRLSLRGSYSTDTT